MVRLASLLSWLLLCGSLHAQERPVAADRRARGTVLSPTVRYAVRPDSVPGRSIKRYDRISTWRDFSGVAFSPFTARFDTSKNYEQVLAERERKRQDDQCRALLERNQGLTRQVRQVDSLIRVEAFGVLADGYRQRFPVVDSLLIRGNRLEFIRIGLFLRAEGGCPVPEFRLENYPTLSRLETEGRAVIIGGVVSLAAMTVPVLPPTTSNPRQDAATYLTKIKDLLGLYFEQLRTTFPQYQTYEARQRLATDPARVTFRRNFCYSILAEIR
jgi:hypothetical protein